MKYFIYIISFIIFAKVNSKSQNLDSLSIRINNMADDSNKVNLLNDAFLQYEFIDTTKAALHLYSAFKLAKKIAYKRGLVKVYMYYGYFAEDWEKFTEAIKYYTLSLNVSQSINDKKGISNAYNNLGNVYIVQGNYTEALKKHYASLKIIESFNDKRGISRSLNNIGNVYYRQGSYKKALKNYENALKYNLEIDDQTQIANSYNNIGNVFASLSNYNKALEFHKKALEVRTKLNDLPGVSLSYGNIGISNYFMNKFDEALPNYLKSLEIDEKLNYQQGISGGNINIGTLYATQKKYLNSKKHFLKAKKISLELGQKAQLAIIYKGLYAADSAVGDFKMAYENHKTYTLYRDSLDNEETRKATIQTQMTYDFEKKEAVAKAEHKKELQNQKLLASEKSRKQKVVILFVVCGLLLVAVFAGFIFRSLRKTKKQKKIIEDQKIVVEQQKHEVELQKELVEEKQKEVMDSIRYARRIQTALLPSEKYIERTFTRQKLS